MERARVLAELRRRRRAPAPPPVAMPEVHVHVHVEQPAPAPLRRGVAPGLPGDTMARHRIRRIVPRPT
jgi:hypothetical protein